MGSRSDSPELTRPSASSSRGTNTHGWEQTAAVVFGRHGAPASDLLRALVLSAQQQLGAQHTPV